jgi:energy-coupling factor transporter ATP-binding protein EcfA2
MDDIQPGGLPSPGAAYDERLALLDAVRQIQGEVERLSLPLDVPGAAQMRQERQAVLELLEGYLVGRLRSIERPLLVVIGGPTGAGKSTLLNSLVGANVSPAGVLRPTTRTPVLLHNPADAAGLPDQALTPGLRQVHLVARAEVPRGLAILDSPDLDSWLTSNRELAAELLGIADLWLFVTTGTDYADAVPWDLMHGAVERRVTIATVLNRMRGSELDVVRRHFAGMLVERGLVTAPVFSVPELPLIDERIPYDRVQQLHSWLALQSGVEDVREEYLGRALAGTLDQIILSVRRLVEAAADQVVAQWRLRVDLRAVFALAREAAGDPQDRPALGATLEEAWQASGHALPGAGNRLRRRLQVTRRSGEPPYADVEAAVHADAMALVSGQLATALIRVSQRWNDHPASASVGGTAATDPPPQGGERVAAAVTAWLDAVEQQLGMGLDRSGRPDRYGLRWSAVTLALATLVLATWSTSPARMPPAVHDMLVTRPGIDLDACVADAREGLVGTLTALLTEQEVRLAGVLDGAAVSSQAGSALRSGLDALERLRAESFSSPRFGATSASRDPAR